ncbi:MAG TPA: FkbM family methyltransferase [Myxococcota bacterium]
MTGLRKRLFRGFGRHSPCEPYAELRDLPRYQRSVVELLGHPFVVPDGISFYNNYREIFVDEIYRFSSPDARPVIVDCGANIGTSILYFKSIYPDCSITALEADPGMFSILENNLAARGLEGITLINKALHHEGLPVSFHVEGADAGRIHPLGDACKESITVETIRLDDLIGERVDFLKIDVEGAETEVICASRKLGRASSLFVEYHSFADSPQILPRLLSALTDCGFRYFIQTQQCPARPLVQQDNHLGMDLQLNIFARRKNGADDPET